MQNLPLIQWLCAFLGVLLGIAQTLCARITAPRCAAHALTLVHAAAAPHCAQTTASAGRMRRM